MRIRHRLLLGFLAIVVIFAVFGGYVFVVWQSMNADTEELDEIYGSSVERSQIELDLALELALVLERSRAELLDVTTGDVDALERLDESFVVFDETYVELRSVVASDADADPATLTALDAIEAHHETLREEMAVVTAAARDQGPAASDEATDRVDDDFRALEAEILVIERRIADRAVASRSTFDAVIHEIEDRVRNLQWVMLGVLAVAIAVAFFIGYRTADTISRPIETLSTVASGIERGEYELDHLGEVTDRNDELGRFARIFRSMAEQIRSREESLRAKISELRIEVDRGKSNEQVSEIADTDFFKDLQTKARELRETAEPEA